MSKQPASRVPKTPRPSRAEVIRRFLDGESVDDLAWDWHLKHQVGLATTRRYVEDSIRQEFQRLRSLKHTHRSTR